MLPFPWTYFKSVVVLNLSPRDRDLLLLLDRTPASPRLIVKASQTFAGEPFRDERRARERLQQLSYSGLIRTWAAGQTAGGITNYYKLTAEGFRTLRGVDADIPPRGHFSEIAISRLEHTLVLAEIIVQALVAAHEHRVQVTKFHRENELTISAGQFSQQPDCHIQFFAGGKMFNVLFEIDRSTESVDSHAKQSIRQKLLGYEAYQDMVMQQWRQSGGQGVRPLFRVAFLTVSAQRAYHILSLARELAQNPDRRLCYAATQDAFLAARDAVREPLFLDHHGHWQALVDLHPSARFLRDPVRLPPRVSGTHFL